MEYKPDLPDILIKHFELSEQIRYLYPQRKNPDITDEVEKLCLEMIAISSEVFDELMLGTKTREMTIAKYIKEQANAASLITGEDGPSRAMRKVVSDYDNMIADALIQQSVDRDHYIGPIHIGFEKLYQLYYDNHEYVWAIKYAQQARDERWGGAWDARIEKARKKLENDDK
jgi:hypothetical protein